MAVLFSPGPVAVSSRVAAASCTAGGHRTPYARRCYRGVGTMLDQLVSGGSAEYSTVLLPASGTGANEAVISALAAAPGTNLVLTNGEFGDRLAGQSAEFFAATSVYRVPQSVPISAVHAAHALAEYPDADVVCLVWCETSTGIVNDVPGVCAVAADWGILSFADAVSAVGVVPTDAARAGLSFLTGVSGKGIGAYPGISFCTYARSALELLRSWGLRSQRTYLNLLYNIEVPDAAEFPVTPPTSVLFGLHAALEELMEEGVQRRGLRYRRIGESIADELAVFGFTRLLGVDVLQNPGLLALRLPDGLSATSLHAALRQRDIVVRSRPNELFGSVLLLGTMGTLGDEDVARLVAAVRDGCEAPTGRRSPARDRERVGGGYVRSTS